MEKIASLTRIYTHQQAHTQSFCCCSCCYYFNENRFLCFTCSSSRQKKAKNSSDKGKKRWFSCCCCCAQFSHTLSLSLSHTHAITLEYVLILGILPLLSSRFRVFENVSNCRNFLFIGVASPFNYYFTSHTFAAPEGNNTNNNKSQIQQNKRNTRRRQRRRRQRQLRRRWNVETSVHSKSLSRFECLKINS